MIEVRFGQNDELGKHFGCPSAGEANGYRGRVLRLALRGRWSEAASVLNTLSEKTQESECDLVNIFLWAGEEGEAYRLAVKLTEREAPERAWACRAMAAYFANRVKQSKKYFQVTGVLREPFWQF